MTTSTLEAGCENLIRTARKVREERESFIQQQPPTTQCVAHPDQVLRIDFEATHQATINAFGKPTPGYSRCPQCVTERTLREQNARLHEQGVPEIYLHASFENWEPKNDGERDHLESARAFARAGKGFLVLLGDCGRGKTHLAVAIQRTFGGGARFIKQSTMLRNLRHTYRDARAKDPQVHDRLHRIIA